MFFNERVQELEKYIVNKKVALVGLDTHNWSIVDYLLQNGADVTVFDKRSIDEIEPDIVDKITLRCIKFSFGEHYLVNLVGYDLIFRSSEIRPDCTELKAESVRGAIITSEIEMIFNLCPGKIIGVTGSKGKTTTACMIYEILKEKGYDCYLGGTMGIPLFSKIKEMTPESYVVLELNNSQLMGMELSPQIAVITNVLPNESKKSDDKQTKEEIRELQKDEDESKESETDKEAEDYITYEKNIFEFQENDGKVILNYDDETTKHLAPEVKGKLQYFSSKTKIDNGIIFDKNVIKSCVDGVRMHILTVDDAISMQQIYSYDNICAAVAATEGLVEPATQARAIIKFRGTEYLGI